MRIVSDTGARLLELHTRVIRGDRSSFEPVILELLVPLRSRLRRSFPYVGADLIAEATTDGVLV